MATWGSWVSGQSGARSRVGYDRTITDTASQRTVKLTVYYQFDGYYLNSNATLTLSGGHSESQAVSLSFSGSGTRTLGTFTQTFTKPWGSASSRTTNISVSGSAGGNPTAKTTYTLPRRLYSAPAAPTSAVAERTANNYARLTWTTSSTTMAPVEQVELLRQSNNNAWSSNPSTLSRSSGSAGFSNLAEGSRYRWRVTTKNRDARGGYRDSNWVYMRPRPVANVELKRSGSNLVVSWVSLNAVDYGNFRVFHNGTQVAIMGSSDRSATITSPDPAVSHQVEVQAYYGGLSAARVASNTVQLLAPPLAPTNLSPDGGYQVAATSVPLSWTHNSVDGSGQTGYELQVRRAGTTTWTTYTGTTAETRNISVSTFASNGQEIEWRVRTKGDHATYGPYSAVSSFGIASRPTVTVNTPTTGQVVEGATVTVDFTISRTPASWTVELRNAAGQVVQTRSDYTIAASVSMILSGLLNGETYSVRIWATDKVDSTVVSRSISVSYAQPDAPTIEGAWDTTAGAVHITVTPPTGGTPAPSSIVVSRSDGAVIGTVPATGTTILTDDHAPIHEPAAYTAVSRAVILGQTIDSPPSDVLDLGRIPVAADFLNWDENVVRVRYSPGLSRSSQATDLQLIDLDDGTADPVAIFGPKEHHTTSLTGLLVDEPGLPARAQAEAFRALGAHKGLVLLRSIDAPPVWGVVTGVGQPRELWGGYQVSLTHTKAR